MSAEGPRRALVLSGGGARGAYEAGVLRFIFERLPERLGFQPRIDIVSGTSVGAIHACFVAATAHLGAERGARLARVWNALHADALFGSAPTQLLKLPLRVLDLLRTPLSVRGDEPPERLYGLIDTGRLEKIVLRSMRWGDIQANLDQGHLEAASVAVTEIASGRVVVFVAGPRASKLRWTRDQSIVARPTRLTPAHALASAAIPVLFPAVRIDDAYYADGGLRLNTPLSPALRLGADRVLVIALRKGAATGAEAELARMRIEHYGNPLFLFGKVLNALLLDHVDTDLARMRHLNEVLRKVREHAGADVLRRVNDGVARDRGAPYTIVDELVLRPSEDLGVLAGRTAAQKGRSAGRGTAALRLVLRALSFGDDPLEADFLSYLYFDHSYTRKLVALGFEDAEKQESELAAFFSD
jgi:NTE family protein